MEFLIESRKNFEKTFERNSYKKASQVGANFRWSWRIFIF